MVLLNWRRWCFKISSLSMSTIHSFWSNKCKWFRFVVIQDCSSRFDNDESLDLFGTSLNLGMQVRIAHYFMGIFIFVWAMERYRGPSFVLSHMNLILTSTLNYVDLLYLVFKWFVKLNSRVRKSLTFSSTVIILCKSPATPETWNIAFFHHEDRESYRKAQSKA